MKIAELRFNSRGVYVEGIITEVKKPREVNLRAGGKARVAEAILTDETGSIKLNLWNEDIRRVKKGDRVRIENGYVTVFKGEKRLNVGRYGKLSVNE